MQLAGVLIFLGLASTLTPVPRNDVLRNSILNPAFILCDPESIRCAINSKKLMTQSSQLITIPFSNHKKHHTSPKPVKTTTIARFEEGVTVLRFGDDEVCFLS